jgi:hypothetical protein
MIVATAQKHPHGYAAHEWIPCTVGVSMSMNMPPATWTVLALVTRQSLWRDPDSVARGGGVLPGPRSARGPGGGVGRGARTGLPNARG